MIRIVCSTLLCFFLCGSGFIQAEIQIENHTDGSTVRYPVILLRGSVSESASDLWVGVDQTRSPLTRHQNRFKSLVRLAPGQNVVRISTKQPAETQELTITYTPQTNPYYVRVVWMTDSSGDTKFATEKPDDPQQYEDRLRTAANLMQTATAERMHDLGLPRKTFRLERDADGRVVVHTLKGDHTTEHYHSLNERVWYRDVYRWINSQHPDRYAKNIVLAAYTRKNPETGKMMAHTALGGGNLGLFGSASVFSWPRSLEEAFDVFHDSRKFDASRVHDDSNSRSTVWGLASTTMGATLHEMGHTFGLPHCTKRYGIMTRGFDYFNRIFTFHDPTSRRNRQPKYFGVDEVAHFAPISATFLQYQPWFALDAATESSSASSPATIRIKVTGKDDQRKITVRCDDGIAWVGLMDADPVFAFKEFGKNFAEKSSVASKPLSERASQSDLPTVVEISSEELKQMTGKRRLRQIRTISGSGRTADKLL